MKKNVKSGRNSWNGDSEGRWIRSEKIKCNKRIWLEGNECKEKNNAYTNNQRREEGKKMGKIRRERRTLT